MDTPSDKKTGLGSSLLLRRTEPTLEPAMVVETPMPDRSQAQKAKPAKSPDGQGIQTPQHPENRPQPIPKLQQVRDRCTLYLDPDVNRRLHVTARIEGKDRSEIVTEVLRQHLPEFEVVHNRE